MSSLLTRVAVAALLAVGGCTDGTTDWGDAFGPSPPQVDVVTDITQGGDVRGSNDGDSAGPGPDGSDGVTPPEDVEVMGDQGGEDAAPPEDGAVGPDGVIQPDGVTPDDTDEGPGMAGYPSPETMLRISSPGGGTHKAVTGSYVTVAGVLFGHAELITWETSYGTSGEITPGAFWLSGGIQLEPGDNVVTVRAYNEGTMVSQDSITITYNHAFKFDTPLRARPSVAWVGSTSTIVFTVPASLYTNFDADTVTLHRVDSDGGLVQTLGKMVDNGLTASSGDEIQGDGVFTYKTNVSCSAQDPLWFRASVEADSGNTSYQAESALVRVDCVTHLTAADCQNHQILVQQAEQQVLGGAAVDDVVASLQVNPVVQDAGRASGDGYGIWIQFTNGVLGAVMLSPAGLRGSGAGEPIDPPGGVDPFAQTVEVKDIGSKRAVILAPFMNEFGITEDGPEVATKLATSECPTFALETGAVVQGPSADLAMFRGLPPFGIVSISSHGEALFETLSAADKLDAYGWSHGGSQEVVWTGEAVQCGELLQSNQACTVSGTNPTGGCPPGTICEVTQGSGGGTSSGICVDRTQVDLKLGRVVITNRGYAVTPSFFHAYAGVGYSQSLVNLGACRTLYNGTMAASLFSNGVMAVTGFSDYVESGWAKERIVPLFDAVGGGMIGDYHSGGEDPSNPGTFWRIFGAANLSLAFSEIINESFETGTTQGWTTDGDGRVISQLGTAIPVDGKFMGLLSTGLGYTVQTGTLEQSFCIPSDKTHAQLYWKFYSEEFKEYCGSQFQDTFQAVLLGGAGQYTLVDVKVDDLCGYGDGQCDPCSSPVACDIECMGGEGCEYNSSTGACTGAYNCQCGKWFKGLIPSDVSFDQGGVYNIIWQKASQNIQYLAGTGQVTLRLYASDTGDSIFDTVILVDAISFK